MQWESYEIIRTKVMFVKAACGCRAAVLYFLLVLQLEQSFVDRFVDILTSPSCCVVSLLGFKYFQVK